MKARIANLRNRLDKIGLRILGNKRGLKVAQNRWLANHHRAVSNYRAGQKSRRQAKRYAESRPKLAKKELDAAKRQGNRAARAHARATYWVGRAKECNIKLHHLEETKGQVEDRIHKLVIESGAVADVKANKVTGGTPKQRVKLAMTVSAAVAREFYSQGGYWDVSHCLTGPDDGARYDCSSWFTSVYKCAGEPDPNHLDYRAGFTGSLGEHGTPISEAQLDDGDAILFGYSPYFHVEMKAGPMSVSDDTIGHGSSAVARGSTNLLPGPRSFRRYL